MTEEEIKSKLVKTRGFDKAMAELFEEGVIFQTKQKKYVLSSSFGYLVGTITKAGQKGLIATVIKENGEKETFNIPEIASQGAIYQDRVLMTRDGHSGGVVKVIKPYTGNVVGLVKVGSHGKYIIPDNENFPLVDLFKGKDLNAQEGHKVVVRITSRLPSLFGEVTKIIGHINDPKVDIISLAYQANVPLHFPDEIMEYVKTMEDEVSPEELVGRKDLTNHVICTIDGIDAKDLDDAIEVYKNDDDTYTLGVHIADVSNYVKQYELIDREAFKRGTSIYMTDYVIPMLPHALSNGICSLNPDVIRLTMSCEMKIDQNGEIVDYDIYKSYIKSSYRLNYDDVNAFYEGKHEYPKELGDMLTIALDLSHIIRDVRTKRGSLDLDVDEAKIIVDEKGFPTDVVLRSRGEGERLIEDFMIEANETVASHIYWQNLPFVYRVHDKPTEAKFNNFCKLIAPLGYKVKGERNGVHPLELQALLNRVKNTEVQDIISTLMLRSMAKAKYGVENIGHFGLASTCYTQFTSPIRRYPDLMVHRLLKLYDGSVKPSKKNDLTEELVYQAEQASLCERRAIDLERDVDDMKKAEYMQDKVGQVFEGKVSGIINSGIFVELPNTIEGMVRFEDMEDDFYVFDEDRMVAQGQGSKKMIKLGDKMKVQVKRADKDTRRIDFYLVNDNKKDGGKKKHD